MAPKIFYFLCPKIVPIAYSLASHIISNSLFQSGIAMMGAIINLALIFSNAELHALSNSNFASFTSSLHNGLEIFEKS